MINPPTSSHWCSSIVKGAKMTVLEAVFNGRVIDPVSPKKRIQYNKFERSS